jgi:hypothetical protein
MQARSGALLEFLLYTALIGTPAGGYDARFVFSGRPTGARPRPA